MGDKMKMLMTKILFSLMGIFFLCAIVAGQVYYTSNNIDIPIKISNSVHSIWKTIFPGRIIDNYKGYENKTFQKPMNRTIMLRMDDLGNGRFIDSVENITSIILENNMSITMAVIPENIDKDAKFISWVNSVKNDPRIEFAQHGYKHSFEEFKNLSYSESLELINAGKKNFMTSWNIVPVTFIPPYNEYSNGTIEVVKDSGFKIVSAGENEYSMGELAFVGYTARTYDFSNSRFIPASDVIRDCNESLNKNGLCVVMIHPQDYLDSERPKQIDPARYIEFLKMIEGLKGLNAEFKTFKDNLR